MTPFVLPVHPGLLMSALLVTHHEIALAKTLHKEALKVLQAYQLIQCALVQQVLDFIEDKYLMTLRNRITGQVSVEIRTLVLHLFRIYRKISPH